MPRLVTPQMTALDAERRRLRIWNPHPINSNEYMDTLRYRVNQEIDLAYERLNDLYRLNERLYPDH